jgi:hypothetical protein
MKLSYIVDLVAIRKGYERISDFNYIRFNYGPFDKRIYACIDTLVQKGIIYEGADITGFGDEFVTYRVVRGVNPSFDKLSKVERSVIDEVLTSLKGYGAKALTELAYRTAPMKKIKATMNNTKGLNETLDLNAS